MKNTIKLSLVSVLLLSSLSMADAVQDAQAKSQADTEAAMKTTDVESQFSSNSTVASASKELKQTFNLGFANTTGNVETLNANAKYTMTVMTTGYDNQDLKVGFDISGYMSKVDDSDTIEEYAANLGLEQNVYENWFGYAALNWYRNEQLGYKNKLSLGAGVGTQLFSDETHSLRIKLGLAQNFADFADFESITELDTANYTTFNQFIEYNRVLNSKSNFYAKIGAQEDLEELSDVEGVAVLGLNFSVAQSVSVSIEEEVRYNGLGVLADLLDSKANTKTVVRLGYTF